MMPSAGYDMSILSAGGTLVIDTSKSWRSETSPRTGFNRRALRGLAIVAKGKQIERIGMGLFYVKSQSDPKDRHLVRAKTARGEWQCDCQDYKRRGKPCKHIYAVMFLLALPNILLKNIEALEGGQVE